MAPAPINRGRVLVYDSLSSKFVFSSEMLAMDNRRAQNDILDIIIERGGKDAPRESYIHDGIDKKDAICVDLEIRSKLEYIRERMDKAAAAEKGSVLERDTDMNRLLEKSPNKHFAQPVLDTAMAQSELGTWEPPSPAKSSHSDSPASLGYGANPKPNYTCGKTTPNSEEKPQIRALEPERRSANGRGRRKKRRSLVDTVVPAGLDARTLVLLWFRGVLDPIHGDPDGYPALLTLDQVDAEILSTKLGPKESLSLLYDMQAKLDGQPVSDMELQLQQCRLCEDYKICVNSPKKDLQVLDEFPTWKTQSRCAHKVCTTCTVKHLLEEFDAAIWAARGGIRFQCPVDGCSKYLGHIPKGGGSGSFSVLLPKKDQLFMDSCYRVLSEMRNIIKQELPDLSLESREMGEKTAHILRSNGYMMAISEAARNPRWLQIAGAGSVVSMSASSASQDEIPVLTKLLRRESSARRCANCQLDIYEVEIQDRRKWLNTMSQCVGRGGRTSTPGWSLHLLNFPLKFDGHCARRPYVCIKCLRLHISFDSQAVKQVPIQIFCLSLWDYQYVLKPEEFRACLVRRVRESYDWACMNSELVASPGFVWCSEPECIRGQVCEEGSELSPCEACGGELYSRPWSMQEWMHGTERSISPSG